VYQAVLNITDTYVAVLSSIFKVFKRALDGLEVCSWCHSSLSQQPLLLPSQVVSICGLQRLALYWFHAPGLQLDNEVSESTDQLHGTVCHQLLWSPNLSESALDSPVLNCLAPLRRVHDSGAKYKYPDLLTYLLKVLESICC